MPRHSPGLLKGPPQSMAASWVVLNKITAVATGTSGAGRSMRYVAARAPRGSATATQSRRRGHSSHAKAWQRLSSRAQARSIRRMAVVRMPNGAGWLQDGSAPWHFKAAPPFGA